LFEADNELESQAPLGRVLRTFPSSSRITRLGPLLREYNLREASMFAKLAAFLLLICASASVADSATTNDPFEMEWDELKPGIWVGHRANSPQIPVMGNTTVVINDEGVLVFDGGGAPIWADRVLSKIEQLTDAPVTHVVTSHWHGDHNLGIHRYREKYPAVVFVAHSFTRKAMLGATMDYVKDLPERAALLSDRFTESITSGKYVDGTPVPPSVKAWYQAFLDNAESIERQYKASRITLPTLTFERSLVLHLGRRIELLHLGRGNTAGDVILWLAEEKILAVGDQVVRPTPYGGMSYPREWTGILHRLREFDFDYLVPGHGDVQTDKEYLGLLIEAFESVSKQTEGFVAQGLSQAEASEALDLSGLESRFTKGEDLLATRFERWFRGPVAQAAYLEAVGEPTEVLERADDEAEE